MSLDIFDSNISDAVNYAARVSAPELPTTFSDNFHDAWNRGYLTAQSVSGRTRYGMALGEFVDDAIRKTGDNSLMGSEEAGYVDLDGFNSRIAAHKAKNPALDLQPITDEMIQQRADEIGKRQLQVSGDFDRQERTFGGSVGRFLGTTAAAVSDPVNLVAFPLAAPESLGVLGTALAWGGIAGGSQAIIEAMNAPSMERIQPGYGASGQAFQSVLETALFGSALGGSLKGLSSLWTRQKTGAWPRTVKDAGNVVESEAQIAATNPLPGVEGEAVHRTALQKAIDDIAAGRPVDVDDIVPGQLLRGYEERLQPTLDALTEITAARNAVQMERAALSSQAQPELPFAGSIAEGQEVAAIAKVGQQLEDLAKAAGADVGPDEARALAERLSRMPAEQVPAVLDEFLLRPTTLRETLPASAPAAPKPQKVTADAQALRDQLQPPRIEEMRSDSELPDTVDRDLDKLMLERPDLEVPMGVTIDADGNVVPSTRKVEAAVAEADARLAAAKEIEACVGPYPAEAAE